MKEELPLTTHDMGCTGHVGVAVYVKGGCAHIEIATHDERIELLDIHFDVAETLRDRLNDAVNYLIKHRGDTDPIWDYEDF
jgi:hypothetical protein